MNIEISEHFTYKKLFKFVFPSIIMMVFTSVYGVVDGFFVSNYAGKTPFAAVNLILPFIMLIGTIGFMIGTGGTALVSKTLGEGDKKRANGLFSMLVYFVIIFGLIFTLLSQVFLEKVCLLLGADSEMLPHCITYARISLCTITPFMLQNVFQSFFVAAGKPQLGLFVTVAAGVTNMALDFIFVGVLKWGVAGAALATSISELIGGLTPLFYFFSKNSSTLKLGRAIVDIKALIKACTNGASEFMTNASMSLVNMLYNLQLIKFFGENGVAAYGVIMYVNFMFVSIYIGYSIGVAPVIGYSFGAENHKELKNMLKKSLTVIAFVSCALTGGAMLFATTVASVFTSYDSELFELTTLAFRLFAISYLISGFNIFTSAFFTALNNGGVSAFISFSRMLLFEVICVFLLPHLFGANAIWLSVTVAELMALVVSIIMITANRNKYHYI